MSALARIADSSRTSRHVCFVPRLCENSDFEVGRRIFVSVSLLWEPIAPATSLGRRQLRKQFCASLAQASFHTALTRNGRCYGATQAGNPGVRSFLDRLRIARVANGNKNWLSNQPSQVVKWIADLFP